MSSNIRGKSVTPAHREKEVTEASFKDGLVAGAMALIPSGGAVWYGTKFSPAFRKATNYQARTALVVMPALFAFGVASELKLIHMMDQMSAEAEHAAKVSEWADKQLQEEAKRKQEGKLSGHPTTYAHLSPEERDEKLHELYLKSVDGSGIRIVPGKELGPHHKFANYWQENPFKVLIGLGAPAVGYIFHQRSKKSHLLLQQQLMQTRVVGQFTVLIFLLGLMGFKEYMDQNGKFITESEAERRVNEVKTAKKELQYRLDQDMEETQHTKELLDKFHRAGEAKKNSSSGD